MRRWALCLSLTGALWCAGPAPAEPTDPIDPLAARFEAEVDRRLEVPPAEREAYIVRLDVALAAAGLADLPPQHLVLVDRSEQVQAAFVLRRTAQRRWSWIGASPVSTGRVGSFDHFRTPTGVFAHSLDNLDFRAEGTFNENGIRGYGERGMRVFDFGWVQAERGWGAGGFSPMRLQMHATDPDRLAPRLGRAESKGCIRIPAGLNRFLDRRGVLDADYEQAAARGERLWILRSDRVPVVDPGRWLVIIDSATQQRPEWAPLPRLRAAAQGQGTAC
jgi:hypothetical protein